MAASLLLAGTVGAQGPAVLSRAEAIREALARNPELRAERERLGVAEAELDRVSRLLPGNPELEVRGTTDAPFGNEGEQELELGLSQELEIAGQRGPRRAEAESRLKAARAKLQALELEVAQEASAAWLQLWRAERLRSLAQEVLALNRGLEQATESRFQAGDVAELERNAVSVDVARAERDAAAAESTWVQAGLELARVLGRPEGTLAVKEEAPPEPPSADVETLKALARERRAELAAARFAEEAAAHQVRLRARERIPNPTLRLGYERERRSVPEPGVGRVPDSRLLASVSIPLPLWYQGQAELRAARAEHRATEVEREAIERRAQAEVAGAFTAVQQTRRALEAITAVMPRVERNLELVRRAFEAGQVDLLSLLNARDRAQQTRQELVEARVEYGRALDVLMRATGQLPLEGQP